MQELEVYIAKLKGFKNAVLDEAELIIEDNKERISDLNQEQLNDGVDSRGEDIKPAYSPMTIRIKRLKGQPTDRVTLHDKGDFYKGIELKKVGNIYDLTGTDSKTAKLQAKYGKDILGLTPENKEVVVESILKPLLLDWSERYFLLK